MKTILRTLILLALLSACAAQTVSFEAVRLADTMLETGWPTMQNSLPVIISGMQSQLRTAGVTEQASKAYGEELVRSMTRDNLAKWYAQALTDSMSETELREIGTFLRSSVGQKYTKFNNDLAKGGEHFKPILKQACLAANERLSSTDRSSLSRTCGTY